MPPIPVLLMSEQLAAGGTERHPAQPGDIPRRVGDGADQRAAHAMQAGLGDGFPANGVVGRRQGLQASL